MTLPNVLIVQHVPWEKPGRVRDCLEECGTPFKIVNILEGGTDGVPDIGDLCGLVIMGGPMGAADTGKHPGLKTEAKLVRKAVKAEMPVLGICLGHQIIATALGAKLESGKSQHIGFAPVHKESSHDYCSMWNKDLNVLHWHGDQVTLPEGAQLLASSPDTRNQAFVCQTALGLQFHLEVGAALLDEWLAKPEMTKGLKKSQIAQLREDFERYDAEVQPLAEQVFGSFAARCNTYAQSLKAEAD